MTKQTCHRCDNPAGEIVILNNKTHVCGACIVEMGDLQKVADRVAERVTLDLTPSIECMV